MGRSRAWLDRMMFICGGSDVEGIVILHIGISGNSKIEKQLYGKKDRVDGY